jgi:uncharacterized protein (DUF1778 family)
MPRRPDTYPHRIDVRLTAEQRELIQRAAEHAGQSMSDYVRSTLLRQARLELQIR